MCQNMLILADVEDTDAGSADTGKAKKWSNIYRYCEIIDSNRTSCEIL